MLTVTVEVVKQNNQEVVKVRELERKGREVVINHKQFPVSKLVSIDVDKFNAYVVEVVNSIYLNHQGKDLVVQVDPKSFKNPKNKASILVDQDNLKFQVNIEGKDYEYFEDFLNEEELNRMLDEVKNQLSNYDVSILKYQGQVK